jgi:hypothetical protein
MNNVSGEVLRPLTTLENGSHNKSGDVGSRPFVELRTDSKIMSRDTDLASDNHGENSSGDVREDSDAETVVMPGKEIAASATKKIIRHEGRNGSGESKSARNGYTSTSKDRSGRHTSSEISSAREVNSNSYENNQSLHTLSVSSPSQDREYRSHSRAESESAHSKAKFSQDSDSHSRASVTRKRKPSIDEFEDKLPKRRIKQEHTEDKVNPDVRKVSNPRSESPTRHRPRIQSSQTVHQNTQKRRKPPPLTVGTKRKGSDVESNESGSPKASTALPRLSHPAEYDVTKKRRDKNGRTPVAKACAADDAETLLEILKDYPEELDEADNAGNTPLQVASLEGHADIVRLLIEKGCKLDCMNCDRDTPLIDSVENGHLDVVKLLLEAGVNPRQVNARGEEPIDLVKMDEDDGEAIKAEIHKYRSKYDRRRQSEDIKAPSTGRESVSVRSPRDSPSLHSARTPPPAQASRRSRPGRNEATRNDLLWVNPTSENLRDRAAKGDEVAVIHILNMKPMGDIEAVLAAAKGGHESCLNLLLAIGNPDPDPDPIKGYRDGYNTPLLAAIGRNNLGVIELLLEQPQFDPTRRLFKNMTYHEISKQRGGENWKEEYRMLKTAYDDYRENNSNKVSGKSNKSSSQRETKKAARDNVATSPGNSSHKTSSPNSGSKENSTKKKHPIEDKIGHRERDKENSHKSSESKRLLKVPERDSREGSNAISDREASPLAPINGDRHSRSPSEAEVADPAPKPRKRLVSGKDLKNDQRKIRRNSLVSMESTSSNPEHTKAKTADGATKVKRDGLDIKKERKRVRRSDSPSQARTTTSPKLADSKESKRQRLNSDASSGSRMNGPARVANMSGNSTSGSAPVAFMGSSNGRAKEAKMVSSSKDSDNPVSVIDKETTKTNIEPEHKSESPPSKEEKPVSRGSRDDRLDSDVKVEKLSKTTKEKDRSSKQSTSTKDRAPNSEPDKAADSPVVPKTKQEIDDEVAHALQQRQKEAEAAQLQKEKEDILRLEKQKQEEEAAAAAQLQKQREEEEEAEKLRKQKEEEAEILRKKQEEEDAALLKKKREEEELLLRKKREEDEQRRLQRRQQEEERKRREKLPNALRIAAELGVQAQHPKEIEHWLPLMTVTGSQLDAKTEGPAGEERWVSNLQVAPILADLDLEISRCMSTLTFRGFATNNIFRHCMAKKDSK